MREFICRYITEPDSNIGRFHAEVSEWAGNPEPKSVHQVYKVFHTYCDCDGEEGRERNRLCIHVAIYQTWHRQGCPHALKGKDGATRIYGVDERGDIHYLKAGKWIKLSSVAKVLRTVPDNVHGLWHQ